jgi:multicomponent Na+:H+ antiporter subunit D
VFAASFVFAWGFFDAVHSHFEVLMLFFLAAIVGFCLTHDLFNLFVWFELMSVAAFALTAYPLGKSSLEGAFNFTVVNSLGSFMMLAGVGLLYARSGTLDFSQMGRVVASIGSDPVLNCGFCLVATALLIKGAIVPFHMWLSDAHAVAPSPVSVIFSGIMVSVALFALAKIVSQIFSHDAEVMALVHSLLLGLGAATAVIGAMMAFAQRHLKRMLAFSTIAHLGIMLTAIATVTPAGLAGFVLYLLGHGLVKGTLFMIAGILLAMRASADEIVLYAKAKDLWPAGLAMAIGGILLGGMPVGLMYVGTETFGSTQRLSVVAIVVSAALTGAGVLRACARIFLGLSGSPGAEMTAPTERGHEKNVRPLGLMLLPCAAMLALAVVPGNLLLPFFATGAARLINPLGQASTTVPLAAISLKSFAPTALMLALVSVALLRERATSLLARRLFYVELLPFRGLQFLHSGLVGDYVVWTIVGVTTLSIFYAL